jgi:DNA polymerase elongation subunit (family B)
MLFQREVQTTNGHIRTIEELVSNDKGGMIISPQTGLHENVIVLDYDNEYSNLIVNHNISYETTISKDRIKTGETNKGLLPTIVEKFLQRRLYFEDLSKRLSEGTKEYSWNHQRLDSLKNILVCLYGISEIKSKTFWSDVRLCCKNIGNKTVKEFIDVYPVR